MSPLDRTLFSFAATTPARNIEKARRRAEKMGLDPNIWFGAVELAAARVISREPVVYVRNILKYYVTYRLFDERRAARGEDTHAAPRLPPNDFKWHVTIYEPLPGAAVRR